MLVKCFVCSLVSATPMSKGGDFGGVHRLTCSEATALPLGLVWEERGMGAGYISMLGV